MVRSVVFCACAQAKLRTRAANVQRQIARIKGTLTPPRRSRHSVASNYVAGIVSRTQEIDDTKLWAYVFRQWSPPMMDEMTIRVAIRATARISFVLFLGAFLGNALYRLVPTAVTRWLKANKDGFVLGFAASHTVHLAFILALVAAIGREHAFKRIMVVVFTTGLLFIYALAAAALFRRRTFLSSHFESLAHYYLVTLFVVSFTRHAITRPLFYTPFALVAVSAVAVRIAAANRSRKEHVFGASA